MLTSVVFLDMSKAFDRVNHETLILKLQDVGASYPVIQWFCSYLNDRQQVQIHSTLSEPLPITHEAFLREAYWNHFYLACTLMILPVQHHRNVASRAM